jgi:hypothetical protein
MITNPSSYLYRNTFFHSILIVSLLSCSSSLYGTDDIINEDDIFYNSTSVVETQKLVDESIVKETNKPSVALSGSLYNRNYYSTMRDDYILNNPYMDNGGEYTGSLTSNLLLDMRYRDGIKGFVNSDFIYYFKGIYDPGKADKTYTDVALREYFIDFNLNNKIYFRLGKQYLKWGPNFFWNPTDLINVDRKDFLDPDKNLEGTRGVKIHMPFGTKYNVYGFINLEDHEHFRDISYALKFEFLVGDTEMAFSGNYKKGFNPVFGYDFSTRFLHIDWRGEMSISRGDNQDSLLPVEDGMGDITYTTTREDGKWIPKASLGFSKSFELLDVNDRVTLTGEFYYNRSGYSYNVFNNQESALSLLYFGLYEPYNVSRYYGAVFSSIKKFIFINASFNFNVISNLTDGSGSIYSSLSFVFKYDFLINLIVASNFGDGRDEYTFAGNDKTIGLEFRYIF